MFSVMLTSKPQFIPRGPADFAGPTGQLLMDRDACRDSRLLFYWTATDGADRSIETITGLPARWKRTTTLWPDEVSST